MLTLPVLPSICILHRLQWVVFATTTLVAKKIVITQRDDCNRSAVVGSQLHFHQGCLHIENVLTLRSLSKRSHCRFCVAGGTLLTGQEDMELGSDQETERSSDDDKGIL